MSFKSSLPIRGYPELDTLRFLSVSFVILHHIFIDSTPLLSWFSIDGYVGVDIFFTLSGFIITDGLNKEFNRSGNIRLKSFWIRRFFRLWPSWLVTLSITSIAVFLVTSSDTNSRGLLWSRGWHYYLHFGNYSHAYIGKLHTLFSHYWSLAVEEHFYVIWPFLFIVIRRIPRIKAVAFVILLLLPYLLRVLNKFNGLENVINTFSTHTRFDALAYGCLFAFIYHKIPRLKSLFMDIILWITSLSLMHLGLSLKFYNGSYWISESAHIWRSLSTMLVMYLLLRGHQFGVRRIWNNNFLARLGQLSYGVYLVHFMTCIGIFVFVKKSGINLNHYVIAIIALIIPYFPAYWLFLCVDKYFLNLRKKLA